MMSLTPSLVSTASGTHSLNQPVLKTRATSCFTCDDVNVHIHKLQLGRTHALFWHCSLHMIATF
jgi:hypothetical protein